MSLTSSGCSRSALSARSSVVIAFLLAASTFSLGQELKAATTLGFSVRVLGPSTAQFLAPRVTALVADETSRSVTIPLSPARESATHVIARFHGDTVNSSAMTARIDRGEIQKLLPGNTTSFALTVPKAPTAAGTSSRSQILELNWKALRTDETANLLEIEIQQY